MPQVQVIKREADPLAQQISKAGDSIADVILRKQAMELTSIQLKQEAGKEQNELKKQEKLEAANLAKSFIELKDKYPTEMAIKMMGALYGPDFFNRMNLAGTTYKNIYEAMSGVGESSSYQKDIAQSKLFGAQADDISTKRPSEISVNEAKARLDNSNASLNELALGDDSNANGNMSSRLNAIQSQLGPGQSANIGPFKLDGPDNLTIDQENKMMADAKSIPRAIENIKMLKDNEKQMSRFLGPDVGMAGANRMRLSYLDTPAAAKAKAIINSIGILNQTFVRAATGSQAGEAELNSLIALQPNEKMPIKQIYGATYLSAKMTADILDRQIPIIKAQNRNTRGLEEVRNQAKSSVKTLREILGEDFVSGLESSSSAGTPTTEQNEFSQMSDEELRKIANGGK